jgi:hypothetical protein
MNGSEVKLDTSGTVHAAVKVSAYLPSDLAAPNNDVADREPQWKSTLNDPNLRRVLAAAYTGAVGRSRPPRSPRG